MPRKVTEKSEHKHLSLLNFTEKEKKKWGGKGVKTGIFKKSKIITRLYANGNDTVDEKGWNLNLLHKRKGYFYIGAQLFNSNKKVGHVHSFMYMASSTCRKCNVMAAAHRKFSSCFFLLLSKIHSKFISETEDGSRGTECVQRKEKV